jgi:hydrogenase/urease accessory protein HupE
MADTIVNTPAQESGAAGWVVAVIILAAAVIGGVMWYQTYGMPQAEPTATNINVTIPVPAVGDTGESTNQ